MSAATKGKMSADDFLVWAEAQEGRRELHDGALVAMSPKRIVHVETKGQAFRALSRAVERAKAPCRVYPDGVSVRIGAGTVFEPDALIHCGPRPPADAIEIADPIIVVEVLSPSTAANDHSLKLAGYFSLPSIVHYLTLDPERRMLIHHKRGRDDVIETRILREGSLRLAPPGLDVAVAEMFAPD